VVAPGVRRSRRAPDRRAGPHARGRLLSASARRSSNPRCAELTVPAYRKRHTTPVPRDGSTVQSPDLPTPRGWTAAL